jgi:hypothetical protein
MGNLHQICGGSIVPPERHERRGKNGRRKKNSNQLTSAFISAKRKVHLDTDQTRERESKYWL